MQTRVNERIRIREVRLIDEEGAQVGVIPTFEALQMARDRGLDLVEVAPNAMPPVCRLMDYGKFRYEQSRKESNARFEQSNARFEQSCQESNARVDSTYAILISLVEGLNVRRKQ